MGTMTTEQLTRKELVLKLLQSREWTSTMEINEVGGSEGTKRVRELRAQGYPILTRPREKGSQWEYRLVQSGDEL